MQDGDGIEKACAILTDAGAKIRWGFIKEPQEWNLNRHTRGEILDALDFVCGEWDFTTETI